MASAKALSLAQEIRQALVQRGTGLTVNAVALDASDSNAPYILVGAGTAGTQSAILKLKEVAPLGNTIIGSALPAVGYAQHVLQVILESSTVGTSVPLLTVVNQMPIIGEALARGTRVEVYTTANATAITTLLGSALTTASASFRVQYDASAQFRLMAQQ